MNGLAGRELDHMTGNVDRLPPPAHEMHLNTAALAVVERLMAERVDIEVRGKLAIDAREQIEVELCGHAFRVVISGVEDVGVLDEVDTNDKGRARAAHAPGMTQKRRRILRLEIADSPAWEEASPCQPHDRPRQPERLREVCRHRQP